MMQWGKVGAEPGEFNPPHGLAFDKAGRLYVADRSNNRIQIFDQGGKLLGIWKRSADPSGVYIDKNDNIYVADSLSNDMTNPGFKTASVGARIPTARWPASFPGANTTPSRRW